MNLKPMKAAHLEAVLEEMRRQHPSLEKLVKKFRIFIAGSFVRAGASFNESPSDIDLFIGTSDIEDVLQIFDGCRSKEQPNSMLYYPSKKPLALPLNVITRWTYNSAKDVINNTDFSVCQAVVYFDRVEEKFVGVVSEPYYEDIAAGRARYMLRSDVPAPFSLIRLAQLRAQGYKAHAEDYAQAVCGLMMSCKNNDGDPIWVSHHIYEEMIEAMEGKRMLAPDYKPEDGIKQKTLGEPRKCTVPVSELGKS